MIIRLRRNCETWQRIFHAYGNTFQERCIFFMAILIQLRKPQQTTNKYMFK